MSDAPKTLADVKQSLVEAVAVVDQLLNSKEDAQPAEATQPEQTTETPAEAPSEPTPPTE